jgi:hypothetical protein
LAITIQFFIINLSASGHVQGPTHRPSRAAHTPQAIADTDAAGAALTRSKRSHDTLAVLLRQINANRAAPPIFQLPSMEWVTP